MYLLGRKGLKGKMLKGFERMKVVKRGVYCVKFTKDPQFVVLQHAWVIAYVVVVWQRWV